MSQQTDVLIDSYDLKRLSILQNLVMDACLDLEEKIDHSLCYADQLLQEHHQILKDMEVQLMHAKKRVSVEFKRDPEGPDHAPDN